MPETKAGPAGMTPRGLGGLGSISPGPGAPLVLRLILPAIITILLFTSAYFFIIIPALERDIMQRKRLMLADLAQVAWDSLDYFHRQEESGRLSREEAQQRAQAIVSRQRFGPDLKDYFWINDLQPRMIMHPYRPDLNGENISDFQDPRGKRLFREMVEVVKKSGEGYVDYMWQWKDDPKRIVPKLSFVKEFKPWGWVVGTGIYLEDVKADMQIMTGRLTFISLGILLIIAGLSVYLIRQSLRAEDKRREAELRLMDSEGMLRTVIDNIPEFIWWTDDKGLLLGCNRSLAGFLEAGEPGDLRGREVRAIWGPEEDSRELTSAEDRVRQTGLPEMNRVTPLSRPTGRRWLDISRTPLRDSENRLIGVLSTSQDITHRVEMEKALKEGERRFRTLVENSQVGIFIVREGRIVYLNPEQRRLFGSVSTGMFLADFRDAPREDLARLHQLALPPGDEEPEAHGQMEMELRFFARGEMDTGGGMRWVHCRANPITYQGGQAMLVVMLDITKAKELEHLVRMQDKMASLGRIAAGIAHEIRNPLSGINLYLSVLEKEAAEAKNPERVSKVVANIHNASQKIESVVKRVLDFSRPNPPRLGWVQINHMIENVLKLSEVTLRKTGVSPELSLSPSLPLCYVDAGLLDQVMMNLVTNALQAMQGREPPRRLAISTTLEKQGDKDKVVIKVSDSGPGVPPEIRNRIFDPFFTIKKDGSGIGLSLSHRIVADHGGKLSVANSPWGGAEFTVEIPAIIYWGYDSHG